MAITPAHRVSKALRQGGMMTVSPEVVRREGVKVRNVAAPASLANQRRIGGHTVAVRVEIDLPSLAELRVKQVVEILTAAGFDCKISISGGTVYVREPGWQRYLDTVGQSVQAGAPVEPPVEWRADKEADGLIRVHRTGCPVEPVGKSQVVSGRTREEIGLELDGTLIKKAMFPEKNYKIIKLHTCIAKEEKTDG